MQFTYNRQGTKYLTTSQFYNGFKKIFPTEICEKILDIYFGHVSRCKYYNACMQDEIKEKVYHYFVNWILYKSRDYTIPPSDTPDVVSADFVKKYMRYLIHQIPLVTNWYYHCNCCLRHQIQKAHFDFTYDDRGELSITTKPQVFIYTPRDDDHCCCNCRHNGRFLARVWMQIKRQEHGENSTFHYIRDHRLFIRSQYQ